jgi:hypothetical protein
MLTQEYYGKSLKMPNTMTVATNTQPVLIELDEQSWNSFFDNAAKWFDNLLLVQSSYRKLLEDTIEKINEFHIKAYLSDILERARKHEEKIDDLYKIINRDSSKIRKALGTVIGKADQVLGDLMAVTGGFSGPWQDLHQLYLSNTNVMGAFAVAEQIGLALGLPEIIEITQPIVFEKSTDQLLIQEFVLEMCGISILYNQEF